MRVWLASQIEDADGGHIIDSCFLGTLSCDRATGSHTRCRWSALCIYTRYRDKYSGWLFPWLFFSGSHCRCAFRKHHSCLLKGGKKINYLSIVSCYCKLLCCPSSNTDCFWPLVNLAQHCLAAVLKPDILLFLFLGFLSRSPCHCGGSCPIPLGWPHTANSGFVMRHYALCTSLYTSQGTLKCLCTSACI